jgi:hypothetical protein
MSWTPNIPRTGQSLGVTRDPVRNNFTVIRDIFNNNHYTFDEANPGKHRFLQLPEQGAAPTTGPNEGGFYAKQDAATPNETALFVRGESNGFEYQLTKAISTGTAVFGNNTNYIGDNWGGWTFLPGGLVMQYGRKINPGNSGTITFPIPFPSGNSPFSIITTNERTSARSSSVNQAGISATSFNYFLETDGSVAINWIAIGN